MALSWQSSHLGPLNVPPGYPVITLPFPIVSHYLLYPEFECHLLNISNEHFVDGQTKCPEQTPLPPQRVLRAPQGPLMLNG